MNRWLKSLTWILLGKSDEVILLAEWIGEPLLAFQSSVLKCSHKGWLATNSEGNDEKSQFLQGVLVKAVILVLKKKKQQTPTNQPTQCQQQNNNNK